MENLKKIISQHDKHMYFDKQNTPPYPTSFCFSHVKFFSFFFVWLSLLHFGGRGNGFLDLTHSHYLIWYFGDMLFYYYPPIFVRSFIKIGPVPNLSFSMTPPPPHPINDLFTFLIFFSGSANKTEN